MLRGFVSLVLALQLMLAGVPIRLSFGGTASNPRPDSDPFVPPTAKAPTAECCEVPSAGKSCCTSTRRSCCCGPVAEPKSAVPSSDMSVAEPTDWPVGELCISACPCDAPLSVVIQQSTEFVAISVCDETFVSPAARIAAPPFVSASRALPPEPPPPRAV